MSEEADPFENLRRFTQAARGIHDIAEQLRAMNGQSGADMIKRDAALSALREEVSNSVSLPEDQRRAVQRALGAAIRSVWMLPRPTP